MRRHPDWLRIRLPAGEEFHRVQTQIRRGGLHTVCRSARCPNVGECFSAGTATFLILGNTCTRGCRFCAVDSGRPEALDRSEPERVAEAVENLELNYAVVTSVTRDDLSDGGAGVFAETIRAIRRRTPECRVEVLIPDFQGSEEALEVVLEASPDVLNHNVETVPRLYSLVRPGAHYDRSIELLKRSASRGTTTKSGLMVGLGESTWEIRQVLRDLAEAGIAIVTLGQYLQPSADRLPVGRYVTPTEFEELETFARSLSFSEVLAGPLVRSSYHAGDISETASEAPEASGQHCVEQKVPQDTESEQQAGSGPIGEREGDLG